MNAREWAILTAADARWAELARSLETPEGGLFAVFDDAGRAGLGWDPRGDARRWKAWRAATGASGAAPERAWAFVDGAAASTQGLTRRPALGAVPEPLAGLFRDFSGLHPVAETLSSAGRLEARLAVPAPWPLFACTDLSKAFAAKPAQWARRLGARGVAAFALTGGRMEIFVV